MSAAPVAAVALVTTRHQNFWIKTENLRCWSLDRLVLEKQVSPSYLFCRCVMYSILHWQYIPSNMHTVLLSFVLLSSCHRWCQIPDSKARWAHVGPTWSRQDPRWANVGPTKFARICWWFIYPRSSGLLWHWDKHTIKCREGYGWNWTLIYNSKTYSVNAYITRESYCTVTKL